MEKSSSVKNLIVLRIRPTKVEEGTKANATMYTQLIGSLMYLSVTKPDMMYVVFLISRFYGKSN